MSLVKQLRREVQALTKYAHQTFSENRLAKNDQQHQSQHHNQHNHNHNQQQQQQQTSAETRAAATIDLMPDFASWKQKKNIMHDTHRDHGNPGKKIVLIIHDIILSFLHEH